MVDLQPGDVVRLKSGGPNMTIQKIVPEFGTVLCKWINEHREPRQERYTLEALEKVEPEPNEA